MVEELYHEKNKSDKSGPSVKSKGVGDTPKTPPSLISYHSSSSLRKTLIQGNILRKLYPNYLC